MLSFRQQAFHPQRVCRKSDFSEGLFASGIWNDPPSRMSPTIVAIFRVQQLSFAIPGDTFPCISWIAPGFVFGHWNSYCQELSGMSLNISNIIYKKVTGFPMLFYLFLQAQRSGSPDPRCLLGPSGDGGYIQNLIFWFFLI